jgi:hypothetical protein
VAWQRFADSLGSGKTWPTGGGVVIFPAPPSEFCDIFPNLEEEKSMESTENTNSVNEIEITEAMIEAGCYQLYLADSSDPWEVTVADVYRAMEAVRRGIKCDLVVTPPESGGGGR